MKLWWLHLLLLLWHLTGLYIAQDIIYTVAGTGTASYSGDGGDATSAALYTPYALVVDVSGRT